MFRIKKKDLDEIRALKTPPNNVKLTLECIAIMLGEKSVEWTDVRKLLAKSEFIPSILSFDGKHIPLVSSVYCHLIHLSLFINALQWISSHRVKSRLSRTDIWMAMLD